MTLQEELTRGILQREITKRNEAFDFLWREHYSSWPPFNIMSSEELDKFKGVIKKIHDHSFNESRIPELLNEAYSNGFSRS